MSRKYSYTEVEREIDQYAHMYDPIPTTQVLEIMRKILAQAGISRDAAVWEWPAKDDAFEDAYDRAMGVL